MTLFKQSPQTSDFTKQLFTTTDDPLKDPRMLRDIWSKDEMHYYNFIIVLEAWPDDSHYREKSLYCSHGGIIHTILGTSI